MLAFFELDTGFKLSFTKCYDNASIFVGNIDLKYKD